jgi:hypothetical protein
MHILLLITSIPLKQISIFSILISTHNSATTLFRLHTEYYRFSSYLTTRIWSSSNNTVSILKFHKLGCFHVWSVFIYVLICSHIHIMVNIGEKLQPCLPLLLISFHSEIPVHILTAIKFVRFTYCYNHIIYSLGISINLFVLTLSNAFL